ncbi:tetrahydrofolate dehydrogenase/cyclohydrolase [Tribonema minus]|uniref:Tetrahydrofolate dehydrogenase/cyclohydrolase n=1 Tax=Tribonema minus TaxID=303371 RepID=A0A835Z9C6_9STRA|nr:tetrahydrofolate dehydrogenase/cyclohydrolase [Tribonema minus]
MGEKRGMVPGLATVLVGDRKDSAKYVGMKHAVAKHVGFLSLATKLPADATMEQVLGAIAAYNADERCHGILLQLPLPPHLDAQALLGAIRVEKDVECFHPLNTGRLSCWRHTVISPCTPRGVMEMLRRLGVPVRGRRAVVIGDSNVVGLPMVLMLNAERATVSIVHKDTPEPQYYVRAADIVIAAAGVPGLVKKDWIKPGAVVIDVGINFVRDRSRPEGFRMVGDVSPCVRSVAAAVSPVPGGVGPMTVAMLMRNCVDVALLQGKWRDITDALSPALAAARRAQVRHLLQALQLQDGGICRVHASAGGGGEAAAVAEMHDVLEQAGASISEAELLTIINDTERNAYNVLSFLEYGQSQEWRVRGGIGGAGAGARDPVRCNALDTWHEEVRRATQRAAAASCSSGGGGSGGGSNSSGDGGGSGSARERRLLISEGELEQEPRAWWLDESHGAGQTSS